MTQTYTDGRALFLSDLDAHGGDVPLVGSWHWVLENDKKGALYDGDETMRCQFDIDAATIQFGNNNGVTHAPGLDLSIVQDMGETYAYDVLFTPEERTAYDERILVRENTKREHDMNVYTSLKGVIQLELQNGSWTAHIDPHAADITDVPTNPVTSVYEGTRLFNQMCETLHARPLRDPAGYMTLDDNMYAYLRESYENQYEDALQGIDNQIIDGTGYGVTAVLKRLTPTIRNDVSEFLPKGVNYGDLRFVKATDERKQRVDDFVKCRVSKTLTYELKRSYSPETRDRTHQKFMEAGRRLGASLSQDTVRSQATENEVVL